MPIIKNRQIKTDFNKELVDTVTLEAVRDGEHKGKRVSAGEIITLEKDEAKKAISADKGLFRVKVR